MYKVLRLGNSDKVILSVFNETAKRNFSTSARVSTVFTTKPRLWARRMNVKFDALRRPSRERQI